MSSGSNRFSLSWLFGAVAPWIFIYLFLLLLLLLLYYCSLFSYVLSHYKKFYTFSINKRIQTNKETIAETDLNGSSCF